MYRLLYNLRTCIKFIILGRETVVNHKFGYISYGGTYEIYQLEC